MSSTSSLQVDQALLMELYCLMDVEGAASFMASEGAASFMANGENALKPILGSDLHMQPFLQFTKKGATVFFQATPSNHDAWENLCGYCCGFASLRLLKILAGLSESYPTVAEITKESLICSS